MSKYWNKESEYHLLSPDGLCTLVVKIGECEGYYMASIQSPNVDMDIEIGKIEEEKAS